MADTLFLVLRKIALSLGGAASEKLSTEVVEAASVLTDFEHGMKQIEMLSQPKTVFWGFYFYLFCSVLFCF